MSLLVLPLRKCEQQGDQVKRRNSALNIPTPSFSIGPIYMFFAWLPAATFQPLSPINGGQIGEYAR